MHEFFFTVQGFQSLFQKNWLLNECCFSLQLKTFQTSQVTKTHENPKQIYLITLLCAHTVHITESTFEQAGKCLFFPFFPVE